jgi:chromosome segregation ATPase
MNTLIKEKLAKSRENFKETENQLTIFKEKVRLQSKHLNDLNQIDANNSQSIQAEIMVIELQIGVKQDEANGYQHTIDANMKIVVAAQKAAQKKRQALIGYQAQIQSNLTRIRTESEFYQKNDECPTCEQKIENDIKERRTHQCSTKSAEFNDGLLKLNEALAQANDELDKANARINEMMEIQSSLSTVNTTIQSFRNQVASLNKKLKDVAAMTDTTQAEDELQISQQEHLRLTQARSNQIDERSYLDVIQEMLRDTGIKAKVIKQYVPLMNKFINQYMSVLEFFVSFTLDDSFNETIRSRHRDDFSYSSFSEGEKMRINLAILFTWRQIAKLKNHNATNLLILDETFDSSLDGDGVDNLLKILNTLANTNVFVITHKPDMMADKMTAKLEFAKVGNFSRLS